MRTPAAGLIQLILPESTRYPSRQIADCEWKVQTFLERDAYAAYDAPHAGESPASDRLTVGHRIAMNNAMRARSSAEAWAQFLDQPIPELASVPQELCIIRGEDADVERALALVAEVVARIGSVPGLTDMAASKMLFLLRPSFVAISDSYVRAALGLVETSAPGPGPWRGEFVRRRFTEVMRAMRAVGQANLPALNRLESFVSGLRTVTIAEDCQDSVRRHRGRQLPARLSLVRILDILLWTEGAIHGPTPDPKWAIWAAGRPN